MTAGGRDRPHTVVKEHGLSNGGVASVQRLIYVFPMSPIGTFLPSRMSAILVARRLSELVANLV